MAVHYNDGRQVFIKNRDLRVCLFYANWLQISKGINTRNVPRQDAESCRHALNQLVNQFIPDKGQQTILLSEMETGQEENILPQESFDWLRRSERATFWLWAYLCKAGDYELGIGPPANGEFGKNWYQRINLSLSPVSHQERVNIIVTLFDSIVVSTPPVTHLKKQVLEKLKDRWKNIYSKPMLLKWLPDEEEAVLWIWNNLQKVQQEKTSHIGGLYMSLSAPGLTTWFTPLSHTERHLALRAALDLWDDAPDTKRLFLLNLNKAWNQQKLRQSRTDKKALNTYLKNETKNRLDFMAEQSDLRISDMLEKLINDHYRKTFIPE
ncbi:hypothetical protein [Serratia fonticola]|uniref:hypothetical protein n=1 Tax=Serratia fonticola TaxID=47917 RepID=UPI000939EBCB|nr:hypothetical protein [Serratia fonticola]OKP23805.1 hypothetical protein BSQ40_24200 [Serratia fonticola]